MAYKFKNIFDTNKEQNEAEDYSNKFNSISKKTNMILNVLFGILAALCIVPFLFVLIISLTSESSLQANGYRFWPEEWSLEAYKYIFESGSNIIRAYGVTIVVTITGTILGLILSLIHI